MLKVEIDNLIKSMPSTLQVPSNTCKVEAFTKVIGYNEATYILNNCHFEFQRSVGKAQVNFLADQMANKRFHPTSAMIFSVFEDRFELVNGYHTLNAIITSQCAYNMVIVCFYVDSTDETREIYTHIDIGKTRVASQRLKALDLSSDLGVPNTIVGRATSAMRYISNGFPAAYVSKKFAIEDEKKLLLIWKDEIFLFYELLSSCSLSSFIKNRALIAPVLSLYLIVMRYDFDNAVEFISGVVEGANLDDSDPRWVLRERLIETARSKGKRINVNNGHISRAVAKCWNNFVTGEKIKVIRITGSMVQNNIVLYNTPLDGSINTFDFMKV
jgi:hypothetical protein